MKKVILYLMILSGILNMTGCSRDEIITPPDVVVTTSGAYILCEGGFSPGTSKLSFYNKTTDSFFVSIFNPGSIGLYSDGMILNDNNLYITEQGNFNSAGKLYRTDTNGTVTASVNVGTNPYSVTAAFSKLFITNGPSNNVSILDKNTLTNIATVGVGTYPQEILAIGNNVFVCNTSVFLGAVDSTVSVINAETNTVVATIKVRRTPSALAVSSDGKLLVGCPGDSTSAAIFKIDPLTFNKIDSFTNLRYGLSKDISLLSGNKICYIGGNVYDEGAIITYDMSSRESIITIAKPFVGVNYSLGTNNDAGLIYVGYSPGFSVSGKFLIYNLNGLIQSEYNITGGIAPRRIVVKK